MADDSEHVHYAELRPAAFERRLADAPIAYLPLGTLEWHGEHLPLGSDAIQSEDFFEELARKAGGVVLPPLFLGPDRVERRDGEAFYGMDAYAFEGERGPDTGPRKLPGSAYWVDDDLFGDVVAATLRNLSRAGFEVVVAHGHGPSTEYVESHATKWSAQFGVDVVTCWREDEDELGIMTDHAAANETSLVLALRPDLVDMEALPAEEWPLGVWGDDPREHASAERGRRAVALQRDRMVEVVTDLLD